MSEQRHIADAVIISSPELSIDSVALYTPDKESAEFVYHVVEPIAEDRKLVETSDDGITREHYLRLYESDEHSLDDEDAFDWHTQPVWMIVIEPTQYFQQRALRWFDDDNGLKSPRDFKLSPVAARILYYTSAHEVPGADGRPIIELTAPDLQKLDANFQNADIRSENVGDLWRFPAENSARFREYANIPEPNYVD